MVDNVIAVGRTYHELTAGNPSNEVKAMTKQDEISLLDATIASLPKSSYLADILTTERQAIVRAIEQDLCFTDLAETQRQVADAQTELGKLVRHKQSVENDIRVLQREIDRKQGMLADLRTEARRILA